MNPPTSSKKYNNKEWAAMFEKLQAYKREHNTCNVPKRYQHDPKLGHWVHYQRTMCKSQKLSQERKDLLESIGFVWSERQSSGSGREQTTWDQRFQELKEFQSIHGHCKVPRKGPNGALGRWVKWQRWNRTLLDRGESSVLTKRKIKLLNSIGFSWGYQRVPPKKKDSAATTKKRVSEESIEPLPFMPVESVPSSSAKTDRKHVVSPPFSAPSFENRATNSTNFFEQGFSNSSLFHRSQSNFVRSSMSPFEEDKEMFQRQDTESSNAFEFQPQFGDMFSMNMNLRMNYQGMSGPKDFPPMMQDQYKFNTDQMGAGNHVAVAKCWKCSVCRYASFDTYEEALEHENNCNGYPKDLGFCRACAA